MTLRLINPRSLPVFSRRPCGLASILAKYATGLKTGLNLFIHPHGGASNRAGLEFIAN
jgi:hypothetical protein